MLGKVDWSVIFFPRFSITVFVGRKGEFVVRKGVFVGRKGCSFGGGLRDTLNLNFELNDLELNFIVGTFHRGIPDAQKTIEIRFGYFL